MAVLIKLVNTLWCALVIKRSSLALIGLFILNCVDVKKKIISVPCDVFPPLPLWFYIWGHFPAPFYISRVYSSFICSLFMLLFCFHSCFPSLLYVHEYTAHAFHHHKIKSLTGAHYRQRNLVKGEKIDFPGSTGPAACSIVLSAWKLAASWLCSASTHSATSINASCYTATSYTPPGSRCRGPDVNFHHLSGTSAGFFKDG